MKTRSSSKKTPEIIQILSQNESVESVGEFKSDDSSCSSVNSDSCGSLQSDSQPFMNLAPVDENKRKKGLKGLKNFLLEQQNSTSPHVEEEFQRAPILNLLRPIQSIEQQQKNQIKQSEESENQISVEPPSLSESEQQNPQIIQMSQPKKKPKLMDQLEKQLNMPTDEYKITGLVNQLRQQRKKQNKKRDYLIQKKMKQYKVGKKKDTVSNQVFNAIQDFFA